MLKMNETLALAPYILRVEWLMTSMALYVYDGKRMHAMDVATGRGAVIETAPLSVSKKC